MRPSELPLAADGKLYHIRLDRGTLAGKVLLVGDPGRVRMFKEIFETVEYESQNREMHAVTGRYHGCRLTALSTGMGCDNIDIVMTELDAALRVEGGMWREECGEVSPLEVVRIGTSGSLQGDVDCGSQVASVYAMGLDGLMNYYSEWDSPLPEMEAAFDGHMGLSGRLAHPYCVKGSGLLLKRVAYDMEQGMTATAPGFYGPQGRRVRLHPSVEGLNERLASFVWDGGLRVTNLEMETSAIYGFSHLMGHEALTVCLIIANRATGRFMNDYHLEMRDLVGTVVERLAT